jgi:STE24 endopeptidase
VSEQPGAGSTRPASGGEDAETRPHSRTRTAARVALALALAALWLFAASRLWRTEVPDLELGGLDPRRYFTAEQLSEAESYESFLTANALLSTVALLVAVGWYALRGHRMTTESAAGRIGTGMMLGMLGLGIVWLAQLPFDLARLWWERRHDLTRLDYGEYVVGNWFALGGVFLFICLGLLIVMGLARPLRDRWWIAGVPVFVALAAGFAWAAPALTPELHGLRDRELAADAREMARAQSVPDAKVQVQDVRRITSAPNAEALGLGDGRVILWDTLLRGNDFRDDEIRVVLAHELAHLSRDHIAKGLGWFALLALPGAFIVARATRRRGGMFEPAAVPLALLVVVLFQLAAGPLQAAVVRRYEAEADWVALRTTRDPAAARSLFERFGTIALEDPEPPAWSRVLMRHPALMRRIAMAEAWESRRARTGSAAKAAPPALGRPARAGLERAHSPPVGRQLRDLGGGDRERHPPVGYPRHLRRVHEPPAVAR